MSGEKIPTPATAWSEDRLLGGRLILRQPAEGYRVAIDPVFLAAAVAAGPGNHVLDMGCGVGAASLCLAARIPDCRLTGFDIQPSLVSLAVENAETNGFSSRMTIVEGNVLRPPPRLAPGSFDHVMANPPFLPAGTATPPGHAGRAIAHLEGEAELADWVTAGLALLRPKGSLTFIHRADRIEDLLTQLAGRAGGITLHPLWPGQGKPAKRILVNARKNIAAPTTLLAGMILHEADGRFTVAANAVLRDAAPLRM